MTVSITDQKPSRRVLTWLSFCGAAVAITMAEYVISALLVRTVAALAAKHFAGHPHDAKALLPYIVMLPIFLGPNTFALLNPLVIARLARKHRRTFAQAFAVSGAWWLVSGVMTVDHRLHTHVPAAEVWKLQIPAAALILAGVLQIWLSIIVAKEYKYRDVAELDADERKQFEAAIHSLKQAQNKNECGLLAATCLQLLSRSSNSSRGSEPPGADDLHTLTKELVRQKRNHDGDLISRQYIKLVEGTLLS
jgi:hypothetical protein